MTSWQIDRGKKLRWAQVWLVIHYHDTQIHPERNLADVHMLYLKILLSDKNSYQKCNFWYFLTLHSYI